MVVLLYAMAGLFSSVEAMSRRTLKKEYSKRKRAPDRFVRTGRCAQRWQFCRGRYRHSKRSCCKNAGDRCKRVGPQFSACLPKRKTGLPCNSHSLLRLILCERIALYSVICTCSSERLTAWPSDSLTQCDQSACSCSAETGRCRVRWRQ